MVTEVSTFHNTDYQWFKKILIFSKRKKYLYVKIASFGMKVPLDHYKVATSPPWDNVNKPMNLNRTIMVTRPY